MIPTYIQAIAVPSFEESAPLPDSGPTGSVVTKFGSNPNAGFSLIDQRLVVERVVPTNALTDIPVSKVSRWSPVYDPRIFSGSVKYGQNPIDEVSFKSRIDKLEIETKKELISLSGKLDALTSVFNASYQSQDQVSTRSDLVVTVTGSLLKQAVEQGNLSQFLGRAADESLQAQPDVVESVLLYLKDPEPEIRASAGRALAAFDSGKAKEALPEVIALEENRLVSAILKSAFRALDL